MVKAAKASLASDIHFLEGVEVIRQKPGMYGLPARDHEGIFFILREVIDNAIDEFLAKRNPSLHVIVEDTGYITVKDEGGGIPIEIHKVTKQSILTTVLTRLHAGGKLTASDSYKVSTGTHGVGVTVTNALSSHLIVTTNRDGKSYTQEFKYGKATTNVAPSKIKSSGTTVRFMPDAKIFGSHKINVAFLREWLQNASYIYSGLKIKLTYQGKTTNWHSKGGLAELLDSNVEEESRITPTISIKGEKFDLAIMWGGNTLQNCYANGLISVNGGTHQKALFDAIGKVMETSLTQTAKSKDTPAAKRAQQDVKYAAKTAAFHFNVFVSNPEFKGQAKETLITQITPEHIKELIPALTKQLTKAMMKAIVGFASKLRAMEENLKKARQSFSEINSQDAKNFGSFGKHTTCLAKDKEQRVLFVIEGDSAGGTAKEARDKQTQECLKLKGKPPNIITHPDKAFSNSEYQSLLQAIGHNGKDNWWDKSRRIGKLVLLADPDPDGAHITTLLLGFIAKICPEFIQKGRLYIVDSALYMASSGNKKFFGATLEAVQAKAPKSAIITRIKGWGEVNGDVLRQVAFDPKTAKYIKVTATEKCMKEIENVLGKDSAVRKQILSLA